jgi:hypothetical protein
MHVQARLITVASILAAAAVARADIIEASSTTLVSAGQQVRGAQAGEVPPLATVVPVFEILRIDAREIRNPIFKDLEVAFSGWGAYDTVDIRWNAGIDSQATGDITTAYVRAGMAGGRVQLRLGREFVTAGTGRMLQLDGGDLFLRLPAGFTVSAFAGAPVSQRFTARTSQSSWNPQGGDLAYGGRVGFALPLAGAAGRGLELGVSGVQITDHGDPVRKDVGLDFRFMPIRALTFIGSTTRSLDADRWVELNVSALVNATSKLFINVDYRQTAPDLFLPRNSILSVFTDTTRTDLGGGARYQLSPAWLLGLDYHALIEPADGGGTTTGYDAAARVEWEAHGTRLGGEILSLLSGESGYNGVRVYGKKEFGRLFAAGDLMGIALKQEVNGQTSAVEGTVSGGYQFSKSLSAVAAFHAGVTPYYTQQIDFMAKLVYNQTYRVREVK